MVWSPTPVLPDLESFISMVFTAFWMQNLMEHIYIYTHNYTINMLSIRRAQRSRRLGGWCASLMVMTWAAVPIPVWDGCWMIGILRSVYVHILNYIYVYIYIYIYHNNNDNNNKNNDNNYINIYILCIYAFIIGVGLVADWEVDGGDFLTKS